jgi:hypothetical protein
LLLPDGRTVGVCTAIASRGDEGQLLRVPLWAQQWQVRNFYVLMLIHDADAGDNNGGVLDQGDGSQGEPALLKERPVEIEFRGFAPRAAVFAQSNCARPCLGPTGAQEEQKQEEHEHPLALTSMVTTAGNDHEDERKPDYVFVVPQSQLRPLTAWY